MERLGWRCLHVVDDADEQVPLAERRLVRRRTSDLPRHAGERGGEMIFFLCCAGQLNAQRPLRLGLRQLAEDFFAEHFLGNADTDLRDAGDLAARFDVVAQVVPQIEQPLLTGRGNRLERRLPKGELRTMLIEQTQLRCAIRIISRDNQIEV